MQTWLDAFVVYANKVSLNKTHPFYGSVSPTKHAHLDMLTLPTWQDDGDPTEEQFLKNLSSEDRATYQRNVNVLSYEEQKRIIRATARFEKEWFAMLTPFLCEGPYIPLCLHVTPHLADMFEQRRVEGWDQEAFELLEKHKSLYIDLPHHKYLVGSGHQIRALIVRDMRHSVKVTQIPDEKISYKKLRWSYCEDADGVLRVTALLTKPGNDTEDGQFRWTLFSDEDPEGFNFDGKVIDYSVFKTEVEELIKLILAYYLLAPRNSQQKIPAIDLDLSDRRERRQWERDGRYTLFSVIQLSLTNDQKALEFSAGIRGSRKGWKLGVRVHIEPFKRWQWKGKRGGRYQELITVGDSADKDGQRGFWKGPHGSPLRLKLHSLQD